MVKLNNLIDLIIRLTLKCNAIAFMRQVNSQSFETKIVSYPIRELIHRLLIGSFTTVQ